MIERKGTSAYDILLYSVKHLPLGSDFPIEPIDPLLGMHAAVFRANRNSSEVWYPDQRLTREQALKGFTLGAAYASFSEDSSGSIAIGKRADFVVFDHNFMDEMSSPDVYMDAKVLATVMDGRVVYGSLN
jgi:predicted amidohydrolase YtcJ